MKRIEAWFPTFIYSARLRPNGAAFNRELLKECHQFREFDDAVSWQYTKRGRKRSERVCAGGLTAGERFKCLKVLIDEDPDRSRVLAAARDDGAQAQRPSIHRQIGIAVNTSVKEQELRRRRFELHRFLQCVHDLQLKSVLLP